ncbi:MAG: flippase [Candidatus Magasanikbacteria bacterium]
MIKRIKNFLFKNKSLAQKVIKNTFWLSTGEIGSRLIKAILIIYAARALGTAGYGVFSYVVGLAGLFTILSDLGLSQILTRQVSKEPKNSDKYFVTGFWIKTLLLALTLGIIIFVTPHFSKIEAAVKLLPLAGLLVIFDGFRNYISAFFRGEEKMEKEAALTITTNLSVTTAGLGVLYYSKTAGSLTAAYVLSAGLGTFLGFYFLRGKIKKLFLKFQRKLITPLLSSAWPIAMMSTFGALMLNIDLIMLGFFTNSSDVGLYSAGQRIVQLLYIFPTIIAASFFPAFSKLAKKGAEKIKKVIQKSLKSIFLLAIPVSLGGAILGKGMMNLIFGPQYIEGALAFQVLIFSCLLVFPGKIFTNYLLAFNEHKKLIPFIIASAFVNVGLNWTLIPAIGIVGSSIATIGSTLVYNGAAWHLAKKIKSFDALNNLYKVIAGAVFMSIATTLLSIIGVSVVLNIITSAVIYFVVLYLLGEEAIFDVLKILKRSN